MGPRRPPRPLRPLPPPHHPARHSHLLDLPPLLRITPFFFCLSSAFARALLSLVPFSLSHSPLAACSFPVLSFSLSSPLTPPFPVALMHMIEPSLALFTRPSLFLWRAFLLFSLSIATSLVRSKPPQAFSTQSLLLQLTHIHIPLLYISPCARLIHPCGAIYDFVAQDGKVGHLPRVRERKQDSKQHRQRWRLKNVKTIADAK